MRKRTPPGLEQVRINGSVFAVGGLWLVDRDGGCVFAVGGLWLVDRDGRSNADTHRRVDRDRVATNRRALVETNRRAATNRSNESAKGWSIWGMLSIGTKLTT